MVALVYYFILGLIFLLINWGVIKTRKEDSILFWPLVVIDIAFVIVFLLTINSVCGHVEGSAEMTDCL